VFFLDIDHPIQLPRVILINSELPEWVGNSEHVTVNKTLIFNKKRYASKRFLLPGTLI